MKTHCVTGEFMGAYYVEERYAPEGKVRRRFWFSKLNDNTLRYEGGMSYINKRNVLTYDTPPLSIKSAVIQDGYEIQKS